MHDLITKVELRVAELFHDKTKIGYQAEFYEEGFKVGQNNDIKTDADLVNFYVGNIVYSHISSSELKLVPWEGNLNLEDLKKEIQNPIYSKKPEDKTIESLLKLLK